MRRLSYIFVLFVLGFPATVYAQKNSREYDQGVADYQRGDFVNAEKRWMALADQGNANAQYAMSILHLKKQAQKSSDEAAFRYLVLAAKNQHLASMFNLGVAYWEGRGVAPQTEKAVNWWQLAAQRDDVGAQYNLGLAYYLGEGIAQNTPKAIYWEQQAANNGHPQAGALLRTIQSRTTLTESPPKTRTTSDIPASSIDSKVAKTLTTTNDTPVSSDTRPDSRTRLSNKSTVLRAAPDLNAARVLTLESGATVRIIETRGEWTQILVGRSYPAWVYQSYIDDIGDDRGKIKGSSVNIRPSPSTDNRTSPPLGQLKHGQPVNIISRRGSWVQILPPNPFPAWVTTQDIQ